MSGILLIEIPQISGIDVQKFHSVCFGYHFLSNPEIFSKPTALGSDGKCSPRHAIKLRIDDKDVSVVELTLFGICRDNTSRRLLTTQYDTKSMKINVPNTDANAAGSFYSSVTIHNFASDMKLQSYLASRGASGAQKSQSRPVLPSPSGATPPLKPFVPGGAFNLTGENLGPALNDFVRAQLQGWFDKETIDAVQNQHESPPANVFVSQLLTHVAQQYKKNKLDSHFSDSDDHEGEPDLLGPQQGHNPAFESAVMNYFQESQVIPTPSEVHGYVAFQEQRAIQGRNPKIHINPSGKRKGLCIGLNYDRSFIDRGSQRTINPIVNDFRDDDKNLARAYASADPLTKAASDLVLYGSREDARRWSTILQEVYDYLPHAVRLLTDADAKPGRSPDRTRILEAIDTLVAGAKKGDVLFFSFSGHGGALNKKHPSGHMIPQCYIRPYQASERLKGAVNIEKSGYITHLDLYDHLIKPLPEGVKLTVVIDSCRSGEGLNLPFTIADGQLDTPGRWQIVERPMMQPVYPVADVVVLTASTSEEKAQDLLVRIDKKKRFKKETTYLIGGSLSLAFVSALGKNPNHSWESLLRQVRKCIERNCKVTQEPQLFASQRFHLSRKVNLSEGIICNLLPPPNCSPPPRQPHSARLQPFQQSPSYQRPVFQGPRPGQPFQQQLPTRPSNPSPYQGVEPPHLRPGAAPAYTAGVAGAVFSGPGNPHASTDVLPLQSKKGRLNGLLMKGVDALGEAVDAIGDNIVERVERKAGREPSPWG